MRKFTLSMLVLFVSVFFISHTVFGQAMHTKTTEVLDYTTPVVQVAKTNDALMADSYSIDFEAEVEWTFDFMPWTVVDVDGQDTWGITGITFPHSGEPMAFIVFNPATTDPPMTDDDEIQPHSGDQLGVCMASIPDPDGNDDWFISDMVAVNDGASFNFWAKSYTDQYGLERFNVAVSTTTPDPAEFTVISGATYVEAPMVWTEYNFDLSDYAGQDIYVAIQCVTFDAFIFMIDDLVIDPGAGGSGDCENFDSYAVGSYVAEEVAGWTTWSNNPGSAEDALITDAQAYSPDNSFIIEGGSDLVQLFDPANITSGIYQYSNMMYVVDGFCGYYNLQKDIVPGVEWGFQVQFDSDGTATVDAGAAAAVVFPFTFDEWHSNMLIVDLDNDYAEFWFDGELMVAWAWSLGTFGTVGEMTLGGANYYAWAGQSDPMCYFDDVCFAPYVMSDCEDFDALTVPGFVAEQLSQLGLPWTTWSGSMGTGSDDAPLSTEEANSAPNSFVVNDGAIDLIYQFGDEALSTGQWLYSHYMYVPTGFSGYFNVQSDPTPGVDWNLELFFNDDGTGEFAGQSSETFTYEIDSWIMIEINYDLDAGLGQVYIDGDMIIQFDNAMTIGSIDYYGWDVGGPPGAYYDDVCFGDGWEITPGDCEDFDALTAGGYVAEQLGGYWTTWSGGSADDALVTEEESHSPDNSFVVNSGAVDLIYQLGDEPITSGQWKYSHYIFVPGDFSGYFNVQSDPTPGVEWNLDVFFNDGGEGELGSQGSNSFTYAQDTWILVEIFYDLDAGYGWVHIDGEWIETFPNTISIGGIDYYGLDQGGPPGAFYDDVCFGPGDIYTGIEEPTMFTSNIYPNPARDQITIESESIIDEVRIYNNMGQLVYSGEFNNSQIMVNTSNYLTGMYIVQIRSGEAVEVRKLIIE